MFDWELIVRLGINFRCSIGNWFCLVFAYLFITLSAMTWASMLSRFGLDMGLISYDCSMLLAPSTCETTPSILMTVTRDQRLHSFSDCVSLAWFCTARCACGRVAFVVWCFGCVILMQYEMGTLWALNTHVFCIVFFRSRFKLLSTKNNPKPDPEMLRCWHTNQYFST